MLETPSPALAKVVIDTQVVMDWLVFGNAKIAPLVLALEAGRLRWIGRPKMREELFHVLGRGIAASYAPDRARIEQGFMLHCNMIDTEPAPAVRLVCRDPDDQMFIDLALAEQARWLISRDRAVLALAKRARVFELNILSPEAWIKQWALTTEG